MEILKWLMLAYGCGILAVVGILVARVLRSAEWHAAVAQAERELATCEIADAGEEDDWLVPDDEEETDAQPWGELFSLEQQAALIAVQQSGAAHARRRMERATQEAR